MRNCRFYYSFNEKLNYGSYTDFIKKQLNKGLHISKFLVCCNILGRNFLGYKDSRTIFMLRFASRL